MRPFGPRRLSLVVSVLLAISTAACGGRKSLVAGTGGGGTHGDGAAGTGTGTGLGGSGTGAAGAGTGGAGDTGLAGAGGGNADGGPAGDGPSSTGAAGSGGVGGGAATGNAGAPAGSGGAAGSAGAGGSAAIPTLTRIEIAPPVVTLAQGTTLSVTVTADYADGSSMDVTASTALTSSDSSIATVSGQSVNAVAAGSATITATFMGVTATTQVTVTAATLQALTIDPAAPSAAAGTSIDLVATGLFSDGSKQDVSALVTWTSTDATVATVHVTGTTARLAALKPGTALVTASLLTVSTSISATVTDATLQSIDVTPAHPTIPVGVSTSFHATATYSDNSTQDVSDQVTWTVSDTSVADVDGAGNLTTKAIGAVDVQAALAGVTGKTTVLVMGANLVAVRVTPAAASAPAGIPEPFTATATYSDGSTVDVTQTAAWSTDGPAASVSNAAAGKGVAIGASPGTVHVVAKLGTMSGTATLTISSAIVTGLAVFPKAAALPVGFTQTMQATATYSDASTRDVTALAVWRSSDGTVASVSNAASGGIVPGTVTSLKAGSATITATFDGASDTGQITATAAIITEIDVAPAATTVAAGQQQGFAATAKISDGTTSDVTTQATWSSSATNVATVSNAAGSKGLATSLARGTTTITATLGGKHGTSVLTVAAPVLHSLQVTPFIANIKAGATQAFTATAIFSDGSTQDATANAAWSVSDSTVATIAVATMGPMRRAVATGVAAGTVTVQATYMGQAASALLNVTAPVVLTGLVVDPTTATVRAGQTQPFTALAVFNDGTTTNVSAQSTWKSSDVTVATVSAMGGMGMPGGGGGANATATATGVAAGTVTLTAAYMGQTATTQLTVTAPQLTGLLISPPLASLVVGQSQQFQATALYDDGTRQTVTGAALWTSSASNVLAMSNGGGGGPGGGGGATPKGSAVALAAGQASVTATYQGQIATIGVTVVSPTLMEVQVTPTNPTVAKGATLQFMAVAVYSDFSTVNVTNTASWTTDAPTIATITNGGAGGRGRASGVSAGKSTVSATYLGITGSTLLTVTDAQVMTIRVTPANVSLPVGIDQRFTATATLTDGNTRDVTNLATWSTSDGNVAAVSDGAGTQGTVTPLAPGLVTLTATYAGVVGSTAVTVSTATLTSVVVTGASGNLAVGGHQQLTATATFNDGTLFDVTQQVTWISSGPNIATVSNAPGSQGLATGVSAGSITAEAHFEGMVGGAMLTVGP